MKAVILAGGYGKRLRPLTDVIPKPMIDVGGKPIIEWQILWLMSNGVKDFVVLPGYLKERLIDFLDLKKERLKVNVEFSLEEEPLGTAGAVKRAEHLLKNEKEFLVINGDIITNMNIGEMKLGNELATMALVPLRSPYGVINMKDSKIVRFDEKPVLKDYWINAGVYLIKNEVLKSMPAKGDMEKTTFVELAKENMLKGTRYPDIYWRSIDSMKDMEEVSSDLKVKQIIPGLK